MPPKKVERVVLVSEKTGAEDLARKMKLSLNISDKYDIHIKSGFCKIKRFKFFDILAVNQEDVQVVAEYAETEENDDLLKLHKCT